MDDVAVVYDVFTGSCIGLRAGRSCRNVESFRQTGCADVVILQFLAVIRLGIGCCRQSDLCRILRNGQLAKFFGNSIVSFFCTIPVDAVGVWRAADLSPCTGRCDSRGLAVYKTRDFCLLLCQRRAVICFGVRSCRNGNRSRVNGQSTRYLNDLCKALCLILSGCIADDVTVVYNVFRGSGHGLCAACRRLYRKSCREAGRRNSVAGSLIGNACRNLIAAVRGQCCAVIGLCRAWRS